MRQQPFELLITDIDEENKYDKFVAAAYALSEQMGLDPIIEAPWLEKAKTHKYISKEWENGQWEYEYPKSNNERRVNIANQTELITGIQPLQVDQSNVVSKVNSYFVELRKKIKTGLYCRAMQNKKIVGIDTKHFFTQSKGLKRPMSELLKRAILLPFIIPIIEKTGRISHSQKNNIGGYDFELSGRAEINGKNHAVTIVLTSRPGGLLYLSIIGIQNSMVKSLNSPEYIGSPPGLPTLSSLSPVRKQSLPCLNRNLIIPYISAVSMEKLPNLEIFVENITPQNRKMKFAKAMRAVSANLGIPLSIVKKENGHAGEPYFYPMQQELSDQWTGCYQGIIKKIYTVVALALDLPTVQIETVMKKAMGDSGVLKYRGKIIYNPETGQPLKNHDFDSLIEAIEKFLNRNTADTGKRIVLDSVAIGKLKQRMAKYQSTTDMKRLKLDDLKYRGKTFDWIRQDIRNLQNVLGEPLTGAEMARYQVAQDYVANLVTRSNHKIRDDIKDTILDGILGKRSKSQVSQDLFNRLGSLNRDWKRIADTEIVNTSNLAGILQEVHDTPKGERVYFRRYELPGCCEKCGKVNGLIVLWSDTPLADDKVKDPYAKYAIWEGKPNDKGIGTGTLHPNCRGGWIRWGGKRIDAMAAQLEGKAEKWDAAVKQAREEYKDKGTENPNDQTPGYVDRINELYKEKLGGND